MGQNDENDGDSYYDRSRRLYKKLAALADDSTGAPDWQDDSYSVDRFTPILGDSVTTPEGGCTIEIGETESGDPIFNFEIELGPTNAEKLIDFLRALPPEPQDDDEELDS